jgi:hypothetical protein
VGFLYIVIEDISYNMFSEQRVNSTVVVTEQNFLLMRSYKSSHCLIFNIPIVQCRT